MGGESAGRVASTGRAMAGRPQELFVLPQVS